MDDLEVAHGSPILGNLHIFIKRQVSSACCLMRMWMDQDGDTCVERHDVSLEDIHPWDFPWQPITQKRRPFFSERLPGPMQTPNEGSESWFLNVKPPLL